MCILKKKHTPTLNYEMLRQKWRGSPHLPPACPRRQRGQAGRLEREVQSLAEDEGARGGDAAAPALLWGAESRGLKRGLAAERGRAGLQGLALASSARSTAEVSSAGPGSTRGRAVRGNAGAAVPTAYRDSQERGCFPPSYLGLLAGGWRVFPAQEELIKKPSVK